MAAVNAYSVVPHLEWSDHPWLSQRQGGSDTEYDLALFFTWDAPAPLASLDRIRIQHWENEGWVEAVRADGAIFPSRDWVQAVVGWYYPFFKSSLLGDRIITRALIPAGWDCAAIPPQSAVPLVDPSSDWRARTWSCSNCHWIGPLDQAAVFTDVESSQSDKQVSVACLECGTGLATTVVNTDYTISPHGSVTSSKPDDE